MDINIELPDHDEPVTYQLVAADDLAHTSCETCGKSIIDGQLVITNEDHYFYIAHAACFVADADYRC